MPIGISRGQLYHTFRHQLHFHFEVGTNFGVGLIKPKGARVEAGFGREVFAVGFGGDLPETGPGGEVLLPVVDAEEPLVVGEESIHIVTYYFSVRESFYPRGRCPQVALRLSHEVTLLDAGARCRVETTGFISRPRFSETVRHGYEEDRLATIETDLSSQNRARVIDYDPTRPVIIPVYSRRVSLPSRVSPIVPHGGARSMW